jgi:hypothetical protein
MRKPDENLKRAVGASWLVARRLATARWTGILIAAFLVFSPDSSAFSFSSADVMQSIVQSARDDVWRRSREQQVVNHRSQQNRRAHVRHPGYRTYSMANPSIAYCIRRFKSYDLKSRTYVSYGGARRRCPR